MFLAYCHFILLVVRSCLDVPKAWKKLRRAHAEHLRLVARTRAEWEEAHPEIRRDVIYPGRLPSALQATPEAADPEVFSWYIKNYGPDVNLFIDHSQIVQVECLRSGILGHKEHMGTHPQLSVIEDRTIIMLPDIRR